MIKKTQRGELAKFHFDVSSVLPGRSLRKSQSKRLERAVLKEIDIIQDEENLRYGQEQLIERVAILTRVVLSLCLIVGATVACVAYIMLRT